MIADNRSRYALALFVAIGAAFPAVWMFIILINGSHLPDIDYWYLLESALDREGKLDWSGLAVMTSEQTIFLTKLVYLANTFIFGGSNIALGIWTWTIAAATWAVLVSLLPAEIRASKTTHAAIVIAIAWLLFSPQSVHGFYMAMSGSVWFLANLAAIGAIWFLVQGRIVAALALAGIGTLSYGTGLAIFPALLATSVLLGRGRREIAMLGAIMLAVFIAYLAIYTGIERRPPPSVSWPGLMAEYFIATLGAIITDRPRLAMGIGGLGLALFGIQSWLTLFGPRREATRQDVMFWFGLGLYALACAVFMALGRGAAGAEGALNSRFASISGLLWISLAVITIARLRVRSQTATGIGIGILSILMISSVWTALDTVERYRAVTVQKEALAISIRLDQPDPQQWSWPLYFPADPAVLEKIRAARHYPFNERFDLDCGLTGERIVSDQIDFSKMRENGLDHIEHRASDLYLVTGFAQGGADYECIVLVTDNNTVEGAAAIDRHAEPAYQWRGFVRAQPGIGIMALGRIRGTEQFVALGQVSAPAAPES